MSKSGMFNQIGKQLQSVSSKQVINSSFLRRGIDSVYASIAGSINPQGRLIFGEQRNERQAVFSFVPPTQMSGESKPRLSSNTIQRPSDETGFEVQVACDKLRFMRTNRLNQRDLQQQSKMAPAQAAGDYPSFSVGRSSTFDNNAPPRFPSQLGSTRPTGKRPTSSATPGQPPEQAIKPGAMIHDSVRRPRPMTAAQQRGM